MRKNIASVAVGLTFVTLLGACTAERAEESNVTTLDVSAYTSPYQQFPLKTLIAGLPAAQAFGSVDQFRATMNMLGQGCPASDTPGACLENLRSHDGNRGSERAKSVAGAPGKALVGYRQTGNDFAGIANLALNLDGSFGSPPAGFTVKGQIMQYCANGMPGYNFAAGTLTVCVTTTWQVGTETTAIQMRVVASNARVEAKDETDPASVFPAAALATGVHVVASKAANFSHKLYASGNDITITDVWWKNQGGNWARRPDAGPFEWMYDPSPESCIDMMFVGSPPQTLASYTMPPFYCLGRCKAYPALVNTF